MEIQLDLNSSAFVVYALVMLNTSDNWSGTERYGKTRTFSAIG